ncbi:hypothetical protein HC024_14735 [Methylococcaceae bacterium WWC4]|nr:hypothetical protein [Methylococcaceae bacterium WWC4]
MGKITTLLSILLIAVFISLHSAYATEQYEFLSSTSPIPDSQSPQYITIKESLIGKGEVLNTESRDVFSISVSGSKLVLDSLSSDGYNLYEKIVGNRTYPRSDLKELTLSADTIVVRGHIRFPQTNVTIFARIIEFEDINGNNSYISTEPYSYPIRARDSSITYGKSEDGASGVEAGSMLLAISDVKLSDSANLDLIRFFAVGGLGQEPGAGRKPPKGNSVPPLDCDNLGFQFDCNCFTKNGIDPKHVVFMENRKIPRSWGLDRFPEDGAPGIPAGVPGLGGSGGRVTISKNDYGKFVSVSGGKSGKPGQDVEGGDPGTPNPAYKTCMNGCNTVVCSSNQSQVGEPGVAPAAKLPTGPVGTIETDTQIGWLNAISVDATLIYAKDLYRAGDTQEANLKLDNLKASIEKHKDSNYLYARERREHLVASLLEIDRLQYLISTKRDFYGNLQGWAPTLSLEVLLLTYKAEIRSSLYSISLYQQILNRELSAESKQRALTLGFDEVVGQIASARAKLIKISDDIPDLLRKEKELADEIESFEELIKLEQQRLLDLAGTLADEETSELDKISGILKIGKSVAVAAQAIGGVGLESTILEITTNLQSLDQISKWNNTERAVRSIERVLSAIDDGKAGYSQVFSPDSQEKRIFSIFEDLKSKSKHHQYLLKKMETLISKAASTTEALEKLNVEYSNMVLKIARKVQQSMIMSGKFASSKKYINPEVISTVNLLNTEQLDRLTRYQHYMVRAFEYEFLTPYRISINLKNTATELSRILNNSPDGKFIDINDSQLEALSTVFRRDLEEIVSLGISSLGSSGTRVLGFIEVQLTKAELATLNSGESIGIDLDQRGLLFDDEYNRRIKSIKISNISIDNNISTPKFGVVKVIVTHPGVSHLETPQKVYKFLHGTDEASPFHWEFSFSLSRLAQTPLDAGSASTDNSLISAFIYTLGGTPYSTNDIRKYTLPGLVALYEISLKKSGQGEAEVSQLGFQIEYEFKPGK